VTTKPFGFPWLASFLLTLLGGAATALGQSDPYGSPASGLETGGLAPPGSGSSAYSDGYSPSSRSTYENLDRALAEDSGRGLDFVWLNAEGGFGFLGLQSFQANDLVDQGWVKSRQEGPVFGMGAGIYLAKFSLGARFRLGTFDNWQLFTLNAEAGLHLPVHPVLEPYFTFGGGYVGIGRFEPGDTGIDLKGAGVAIRGFNARAGFGLDVFVSKVVSLGANLTGEVLFLSRAAVDPDELLDDPNNPSPDEERAAELYSADGSSIGTAGTLTGVIGLHF